MHKPVHLGLNQFLPQNVKLISTGHNTIPSKELFETSTLNRGLKRKESHNSCCTLHCRPIYSTLPNFSEQRILFLPPPLILIQSINQHLQGEFHQILFSLFPQQMNDPSITRCVAGRQARRPLWPSKVPEAMFL